MSERVLLLVVMSGITMDDASFGNSDAELLRKAKKNSILPKVRFFARQNCYPMNFLVIDHFIS